MSYKSMKPTTLKIVMQDFMSSLAALVSIVIIITLVIMLIQTPPHQQANGFWEAMGLFFGIVVVCGLILYWRIPRRVRAIHAKWDRSIPAEADILSLQDVGAGRYRQRVLRYRYEYEGKIYEKGTNVGRNWQPGKNTIHILVDPEEPDKALVTTFYA